MNIENKNTPLTVEQHLNNIDYSLDYEYIPSDFALEFINFIKLVNGVKGEEHPTPVVHYKMLDQVAGMKQNIANMCSRGLAKTAVFGEYLILYMAVYGAIPGFGKVNYTLYVSDSIENGVKKMRLRLERRRENSKFLMHYITEVRFTDIRWAFKNKEGNDFVVTAHGAKALSLDSILYTSSGTTTIGDCIIGDNIYAPNGEVYSITNKSIIFNKPIYLIELNDGRNLKVSEDHINSVYHHNKFKNISTKDMLNFSLIRKNKNGTKRYCFKIKNTKPLNYSSKQLFDPYTLGLLLGDGSFKADGSNTLHAHKDDMEHYLQKIPYKIGTYYLDKRNNTVVTVSLLKIFEDIDNLGLRGKKSDTKFIPNVYFYSSIEQRLQLLRGLIDTDGTISPEGKVSYCSTSKQLIIDIMRLVRSLGGTAKMWPTTQIEVQHSISYKVGIWLNLYTASLPRKSKREKFNKSKFVSIKSITRIPNEPSQCISINSPDNQFLTNDYTPTHNTGVRGTVELNTRPQIAILDDLLSDEDARSATVIASIEDTVYKAIDYALHPSKNKIIWSGTPFNARDPLYKAIESGAWYVNVFPICETFPCTKEEFKGAWEDRFTYEYVLQKYNKALKVGKIDTFNQELMLRIMSEEDRLILDSDIGWYKHANVLLNKQRFNFYITTDFATSEETSSDYSVISVWAYNNNGDWLWVDGIVKKQLMDKNIDDLFRLVQMYKPQQVGIEVSGQQGGFIQWIQNEMGVRNSWFTLASEDNKGKSGIRPNTNKMVRFNIVVPWFKTKKIWFPEELKTDPRIAEFINELSLTSPGGFKSKNDDCIDTVSMLSSMTPWKPAEDTPDLEESGLELWEDDSPSDFNDLDSYVV